MIQYGEHKVDDILPIQGLKDIRFQKWLREILKLNWTGYDLWLYGGILENRTTADIDGCIIGEPNRLKIQYLLDNIVRISFELQIWPDIQYNMTGEVYDPIIDKEKTITYAYYRRFLNYKGLEVNRGEYKDGWIQKTTTWPQSKESKQPQHPIKLI